MLSPEFNYSPLGNIFTKGLDKDNEKEGLFKRLENIKDKNEELLNPFSAANKVSVAAKNESDYNYNFKYSFYKFHRDFKKFKRISGYKLELLSPETIKLLGSTKKDVDKDKDGEDVLKLESVEVVLMHCNLVNNSYQQASKVLFTFVPNKQFG